MAFNVLTEHVKGLKILPKIVLKNSFFRNLNEQQRPFLSEIFLPIVLVARSRLKKTLSCCGTSSKLSDVLKDEKTI